MKKFTTILVLLFVLSVSAFADNGGIIHTGGIACPQGQTCSSDNGIIHTGGKSCPEGQTCLADDGVYPVGGISENPFVKNFYDFLKSVFG